STRLPTAATARWTWRCCACSARPPSACSQPMRSTARWRPAGASGWRSTSCFRCSCTRCCSAAPTSARPKASPGVTPAEPRSGSSASRSSRAGAGVGSGDVRDDTASARHRLYLLARVIVARHYRQQLTLEVLARALASSPRQIQRAYMQCGHTSFREDLLARRMSVAAELLLEQRSIAVADVGRLVGYRQSSRFASAFRRRYGLTPSRFRAAAPQRIAASSRAPGWGNAGGHDFPGSEVLGAVHGLRAGQVQAHQRSAARGGLGGDAPALLAGDLAHDREPESRAGATASLGARSPAS